MDRLCAGSSCYSVKRRKVLPRQSPSITPALTSLPATSNAEATGTPVSGSSSQPGTSDGPITSPPASPTVRQDPSDASGTSEETSGTSSDTISAETSAPTSNPPSSGQSSDPTSPLTEKPTDPPSTDPSSEPSSQPSSDPPTSPPTSPPLTSPPSSEPTSQPPTSKPTSEPSSEPSSPPPSSAPNSNVTSPPPSTTPPPTPTSTPTTSQAIINTSSDTFQTTITSAVATTVINGTTSTIFTAIPTTLSSGDDSSSTSAMKRNIIAGTVGGAAFVILLTALFLFYRRHQTKKLSFFKRLQPKPRTRLLDGEDMDDYDLGPPMTRYSDYPASVTTSHAQSRSIVNATPSPVPGTSPMSRDFNNPSPGPSIMGSPMDPQRTPTPNRGGLPPGAAVPHLLGRRSESGSIFHEAVWPPPSENSTLVDPLVNASSQVDLSRIVDDVMGPSIAGAAAIVTAGAAGGSPSHPPPSSFRSAPSHGTGASSRSLIGDDPFASLGAVTPQPVSATHSRETSETPLLPKTNPQPGYFDRGGTPESPGSPLSPPKIGTLFVTNMGPLSPASTLSPGSPAPTAVQQQALGQTSPVQSGSPTQTQPRNWLQRSPKKTTRDVPGSSVEGETGVDVTDVTSDGHGMGLAL